MESIFSNEVPVKGEKKHSEDTYSKVTEDGLHNKFFQGGNEPGKPTVELSELSRKAVEIDFDQKALTGRTPEDLELDTGISAERFFPEGKKVLYVGDPYMVMGKIYDNPNFVTIDYEFGDQNQFIYSEEELAETLGFRADDVVEGINYILEKNTYPNDDFNLILEEVLPLLKTAINNSREIFENTDFGLPESREQCKKAIQDWELVRSTIGKKRSDLRGEINKMQKNLDGESYFESIWLKNKKQDLDTVWYLALDVIRGFNDLPDYYEKVEPDIVDLLEEEQEKERKEKEAAGEIFEEWSDEKIEEFYSDHYRKFSDKIRPKRERQPEESSVIRGAFPSLPFKEKSFDSFVASWSLSTHFFKELDEEKFGLCWEEMMRILKSDGEAFIFPLNWNFDDEQKEKMIESLQEFSKKNPQFLWELWMGENQKIVLGNDINLADTLFIKKKAGDDDIK